MSVKYLNFACDSANAFWLEICEPAHTAFFQRPSRSTAIQAAWPTWHVIDWLFRERKPGGDLGTFRKCITSVAPRSGGLVT